MNMCNWTNRIQEAGLYLCAHKFISCVSIIGIIIGTAATLASFGLQSLADRQAKAVLGQWSQQIFVATALPAVHSVSKVPASVHYFQWPQVAKQFGSHWQLTPFKSLARELSFNGQPIHGHILVTPQDFFHQLSIPIEGRALSALDALNKVCLLGESLAHSLGINAEHLGQWIDIQEASYQVVGIIQSNVQFPLLEFDLGQSVILTLSQLPHISGDLEFRDFLVHYEGLEAKQAYQRFRIKMENWVDAAQWFIRDTGSFTHLYQKQIETILKLLNLVAIITFIVGALSLLGLRLTAFAQRKAEMGVRLSIGATRRTLFLLFISESLILSILGALIGVGVGEVGIYKLCESFNWPYLCQLQPILMGFGLALGVGLISGAIPAWFGAKSAPGQLLSDY